MTVPIALLVFNRPFHTQRVFKAIADYKPAKLLVVADGPRFEEEAELCGAVRAVIERVDWECEVLTNYADVNLGCKRRVASGLEWVFRHCEEAIILEDDCLPHLSFFAYCAELLDRYRDDERVMQIHGNNLGATETRFSYYYSRFPQSWGWASWRRAWRHYDIGMAQWPALRATPWLYDILGDAQAVRYWRAQFETAYANAIDTWDYQWTFSCWLQNGLAIVPGVNLVSNIGFGAGATHTTDAAGLYAGLPVSEVAFPLRHPPYIVRDREADMALYAPPALRQRIQHEVLGRLPTVVRRSLRSTRSWGSGMRVGKD